MKRLLGPLAIALFLSTAGADGGCGEGHTHEYKNPQTTNLAPLMCFEKRTCECGASQISSITCPDSLPSPVN